MRKRLVCRTVYALTAALLLLSGCEKTPGESSDVSSAPAASTVTPATRSSTDMFPVPGKNSDGVQVNWSILPSPDPSADTDDADLVAFSPHYQLTFTPRDDYGALHTYTGVINVGSYAYPVYGLLDGQLRILTPAVYDGISDSDGAEVWLLYGNTWKAEDDPRVKKIYAYDGQFECLYQHIQVIARDGSWMLDDNYCLYERITDGYMLFSVDGSLTLINDKGKITAKLSGGDYCWVQPIEKGRLFAFHGLDGAVTVRDRTGKTVSRFTKAQMGDDVRFTYPGGLPPKVQLVWKDSIGYVQHYDDSGYGREWITRYLYADTGEVKKPPVKGLVRNSFVEPDEAEMPYVSHEVSVPETEVPEAVRLTRAYGAYKDLLTGEIYFCATNRVCEPGESYEDQELWDLYDHTGRLVMKNFGKSGDTLSGGYIKQVRSTDDGYTTTFIRCADSEIVFRLRADINDMEQEIDD